MKVFYWLFAFVVWCFQVGWRRQCQWGCRRECPKPLFLQWPQHETHLENGIASGPLLHALERCVWLLFEVTWYMLMSKACFLESQCKKSHKTLVYETVKQWTPYHGSCLCPCLGTHHVQLSEALTKGLEFDIYNGNGVFWGRMGRDHSRPRPRFAEVAAILAWTSGLCQARSCRFMMRGGNFGEVPSLGTAQIDRWARGQMCRVFPFVRWDISLMVFLKIMQSSSPTCFRTLWSGYVFSKMWVTW